MKLAQALFEARRIAAEELIEDELLAQDAKTRKLDQATLIQREITAKVAEPTEAEAALWYQQNQSRLQGASLEQARTAIKSYLLQQRTLAARQKYLDGLRARIATRIVLEATTCVRPNASFPTGFAMSLSCNRLGIRS